MTRSVYPSLIGGCECDEGGEDDVDDDVDLLRLVVLAGVVGDGGDGVVHASGDVRVRPALRGRLGRRSGTIGFTTSIYTHFAV